MAASLARRSAFLRCVCSSRSKPSLSSTAPLSSSLLSRSPPVMRFQRPLQISSPARYPPPGFRREFLVLSSMLPIHSAIASARLVSKLPKDADASIEGRFANYVSPI